MRPQHIWVTEACSDPLDQSWTYLNPRNLESARSLSLPLEGHFSKRGFAGTLRANSDPYHLSRSGKSGPENKQYTVAEVLFEAAFAT